MRREKSLNNHEKKLIVIFKDIFSTEKLQEKFMDLLNLYIYKCNFFCRLDVIEHRCFFFILLSSLFKLP